MSKTQEENHENFVDGNILVRKMKKDELLPAMRLFSSVGYNDSVSIVEAYYEHDPEGFFVAIDQDDDDRVIASCAAPITTHQTSFLGMYVVDPRFQGRGIGVKTFNECLRKVGEKNCGLSAVPAKFSIYRNRAGFKVEENRAMLLFKGKPEGIENLKASNKIGRQYRVEKLTSIERQEELVKKIIEFDQSVHLDSREQILRSTLSKSDTTTFAVIDTDQEDQEVVGYGCIRSNIIGRSQPGPLYAIDDAIGEVIFGELLKSDSKYRDSQMMYCTMDNSRHGIWMAEKALNLEPVSECQKLYTKFIPPFNYDRLFCCHTPDFSC